MSRRRPNLLSRCIGRTTRRSGSLVTLFPDLMPMSTHVLGRCILAAVRPSATGADQAVAFSEVPHCLSHMDTNTRFVRSLLEQVPTVDQQVCAGHVRGVW